MQELFHKIRIRRIFYNRRHGPPPIPFQREPYSPEPPCDLSRQFIARRDAQPLDRFHLGARRSLNRGHRTDGVALKLAPSRIMI
jgi:hypothetical protein